MKTAVSIPDEVFAQAELVAKRLNKSRSELYAEALAEYLARRTPAELTAAVDAAVGELGAKNSHDFLNRSAHALLTKETWE